MGLTVALVTGLFLVRLLEGAGTAAATGGGRPAGAAG
jgi:hypothetical protein